MEQVDDIFFAVVSELFGPEFTVRPQQKEAVFSVLCRKDTVVVLPTGYGKSFVFQVLPRFMDRLRRVREDSPRTIVLMVSPLIALMEDQVIRLRRIGVEAGRWYPGLCEEESEKFIQGTFFCSQVTSHIILSQPPPPSPQYVNVYVLFFSCTCYRNSPNCHHFTRRCRASGQPQTFQLLHLSEKCEVFGG